MLMCNVLCLQIRFFYEKIMNNRVLIILSLLLLSPLLSCDKLDEQAQKFGKRRLEKLSGQREDWEKKIKDLESKIQQCVTDSNRLGLFYRKMADEHARLNNYHQAMKYYELAIKYGETRAEVYHDLAAVQATQARFERNAANNQKSFAIGQKALVNYNKALLKHKDRPSSLFGKGLLLYYVLDRQTEGVRILQELRIKDPKNTRLLFALGRIYFEREQYKEALSAYQSILSLTDSKSEEHKQAESNINQILILQKQKPSGKP